MSKVVSFPQSEPTVINDHMRNYDLSLLLSNTSNAVAAPPQSAPMPVPVIDEPASTGVTSPLQAPVAGDFVPALAEAPAIHVSPPLPPGVTTRSLPGKSCPRKFTDGTIQCDPNRRSFFAEPTSHRLALSEPAWHNAMEADFDALQKNNTWALIPRPTGVNVVSSNPVFHARTKYIEVDFHFVREKVALGALDVQFISSSDQVADGFTKPTTRNMLDRLRYNLNLVAVKIEGECKQGS
ncbi:hypothetical protein L6452_33280 [Arctium lappa]|uniref:Uncharacterized protein n=1 Tax=Arctium lappa TaxID=4217 RepID=A0ACB8ZBI5_ARCLA|nr:hypothetical protein L6452_33280 [Arctium lappa]